jgi:hypothetical protein
MNIMYYPDRMPQLSRESHQETLQHLRYGRHVREIKAYLHRENPGGSKAFDWTVDSPTCAPKYDGSTIERPSKKRPAALIWLRTVLADFLSFLSS